MDRPRLVLASASPRRRLLLPVLGIDFETVVPDVDEVDSGGTPAELVLVNARLKAERGLELIGGAENDERIVLGVDTDVAVDGRLLGKPADRDEAAARLRTLSGRSHEVLGAVVLRGAVEAEAIETTKVTFHPLSESLLDGYLDSGEWEDRAGGYAVQGLGSTLVAAVDGDLANVIGLPVRLLGSLLAAGGALNP